MNRASLIELRLHSSILENSEIAFQNLFDAYNDHLLSCLFRWYSSQVYTDTTLVHEAVYEFIKFYSEHPRAFNPEHGSLQKFLEIGVDNSMQRIFEREKHPMKITALEHILARHFDNDRDTQLAKLLLKKEEKIAPYISLLDIGSYRINHQQTEIKRQQERIRKILDQYNVFQLVPDTTVRTRKTRTKTLAE